MSLTVSYAVLIDKPGKYDLGKVSASGYKAGVLITCGDVELTCVVRDAEWDGVMIEAHDTPIRNVVTHGVVALGCGRHGMMHSPRNRGISYCRHVNSVSEGCGGKAPGHGFSSGSGGYSSESIKTPWENYKGTIHRQKYSGWFQSINRAYIAYDVEGLKRYELVKANGFSRLAVGKFFHDKEWMYVNLGLPLEKMASIPLRYSATNCHHLTYQSPLVIDQIDFDGKEGHGVAFDDLTSYSAVLDGRFVRCQGVSVSVNGGAYNRIERCLSRQPGFGKDKVLPDFNVARFSRHTHIADKLDHKIWVNPEATDTSSEN